MSAKSLILLFCLLALLQSQDWDNSFDGTETGTLGHLFASSINLNTFQVDDVTGLPTSNLNFTEAYQSTIPEGIFSSA